MPGLRLRAQWRPGTRQSAILSPAWDQGTEPRSDRWLSERYVWIAWCVRTSQLTITCRYPFPGRSYCREEWFKPDSNPTGIDHCGEDADRPLFHGLTERLPVDSMADWADDLEQLKAVSTSFGSIQPAELCAPGCRGDPRVSSRERVTGIDLRRVESACANPSPAEMSLETPSGGNSREIVKKPARHPACVGPPQPDEG